MSEVICLVWQWACESVSEGFRSREIALSKEVMLISYLLARYKLKNSVFIGLADTYFFYQCLNQVYKSSILKIFPCDWYWCDVQMFLFLYMSDNCSKCGKLPTVLSIHSYRYPIYLTKLTFIHNYIVLITGTASSSLYRGNNLAGSGNSWILVLYKSWVYHLRLISILTSVLLFFIVK